MGIGGRGLFRLAGLSALICILSLLAAGLSEAGSPIGLRSGEPGYPNPHTPLQQTRATRHGEALSDYSRESIGVRQTTGAPRVPSGYEFDLGNKNLRHDSVARIDPLSNVAPNQLVTSLVTFNHTIYHGPYSSPVPTSPQNELYDPDANEIFIGDSGGSEVTIINATSGTGVGVIQIYGETVGLAYDPVHHYVFIGEGWSDVIKTYDSYSNRLVNSSIIVGTGPLSLVVDPEQNKLYSANFESGNVSVVNTTTLRVEGQGIQLGGSPSALALVPNLDELWVANFGYEMLAVINSSTDNVSRPVISTNNGSSSTYGQPGSMVYDAAANRLFVGNLYEGTGYTAGNISVLDPTTRHFIGGGLLVTGASSSPFQMVVDPYNGYIYSGFEGVGVVVIDGLTLARVEPNITTTTDPTGLVVVPDSKLVFIIDGEGVNLSIYDPATFKVVAPDVWIADTLEESDYDASTGFLFVAAPSPVNTCTGPGRLLMIRPGVTPTVLDQTSVGFGPYAVADDGPLGDVFVTDECSSNVAVLNATTDALLRTIPVGSGAFALAFDPLASSLIVANEFGFNLTVISVTNWSVHQVSLFNQSYPVGLALDTKDDRMFIAEWGSWNVTILNATSLSTLPISPRLPGPPASILYDPNNGEVYTANSAMNLTSIRASTGLVVNLSIDVGGDPMGLALAEGSGELFVTDEASANLSTVDDATNNPNPIKVRAESQLVGLTFDPTADELFVSTDLGTIGVLASVPSVILTESAGVVDQYSPVRFETEYVARGTYETFNYSGLPSGCFSANLSALSCAPNTYGVYQVSVELRDEWGENTSEVTLTVERHLANVSITLGPSQIDLGQAINIATKWTGGVQPWVVNYTGLPEGCRDFGLVAGKCIPAMVGNYLITATVQDSDGQVGQASSLLQVVSPPEILSVMAYPSNLTIGAQLLIFSQESGGVGNLTYSYSGLPPGCLGSDSNFVRCVPTSAGNTLVVLNVTDSLGVSTSGSIGIQVVPPTLPEITIFAATPNPVFVNSNLSLQVDISAPLKYGLEYSYEGLPPGCTSENESELTCVPSEVGLFHVTVQVRDVWGTISAPRLLNLEVIDGPSEGSYVGNGNNGISQFEITLLWGVTLVSLTISIIAILVIVTARSQPGKNRSRSEIFNPSKPE